MNDTFELINVQICLTNGGLWKGGRVDNWEIGVMECWNVGKMENDGVLE